MRNFILFLCLTASLGLTAQQSCNYTLQATDSFEDGWDSGILNITIAGEVTSYTLQDGNFEQVVLPVEDGGSLALDWAQDSDFNGEVGYELFDSEGNSLFAVTNPSTSDEPFTTTVVCSSCSIPVDIQVTATTTSTVTFSWIGTNAAINGYDIVLTLPGDNPVADQAFTYSAASGAESFTATGLESDSTYDIYIRSGCDAENSNYAGPSRFSTEPPCPAPSGLAVTFVGDTFINAQWGASANAQQYEIVAFAENVNPEVGSPVASALVSSTENSARLSGLEARTPYDIFIRAGCGAEGNSAYAGPVTITTVCNPLSAPLLETFNGPATPFCWSERGFEAWQYNSEPDYAALEASDHTTGNLESNAFTWIDSSVNQIGDTSGLATPLVDVSTLDNPIVSFWVFSINSEEPESYNTLNVEVFDGETLSTFIVIDRMTQGEDGWQQYIIDLGGDYNITGPVQVIFRNITTASGSPFFNDILIDDVSFEESLCIDPEVNVETVTTGGVVLNWTDLAFDAHGYSYAIFNAGENPESNTPVAQGETDQDITTATVTGLSPAMPYEAYVIANCSDNFGYEAAFFITEGRCDPPEQVVAEATGATTALISWNIPNSDVSGFEYLVLEQGGDPYAATPVTSGTIGSSENMVPLTGLVPNSTYDAYVRSSCAPESNGNSTYAGPIPFTTFISCGGTFQDSGGADGNYGNSENITYFFSPEVEGENIILEFTMVDIEPDFDFLEVYNGLGTDGELLSEAVTEPMSFFSTSQDGGLTVVFRSDVSINRAGWEAQVSCGLTNDSCINAVTLQSENNFQAAAIVLSTLQASNSGVESAPSCGPYETTSADIFFTVSVPDSGALTVETGAGGESPINTTSMAIYSGGCEALVELACDDGSANGGFAKVELEDLSPGQELIVRVYGAGSEKGTFLIGAHDDSILGQEDFSESQVTFYPNPVQDVLYILAAQSMEQIHILNISGQTVRVLRPDKANAQVQMAGLPKGLYFARIISDTGEDILRILKK